MSTSGGSSPGLPGTALVGRLCSTYHLSHQKIQRLLDEAFGVPYRCAEACRYSTGGISCICRRLNGVLEHPVGEALVWLQ